MGRLMSRVVGVAWLCGTLSGCYSDWSAVYQIKTPLPGQASSPQVVAAEPPPPLSGAVQAVAVAVVAPAALALQKPVAVKPASKPVKAASMVANQAISTPIPGGVQGTVSVLGAQGKMLSGEAVMVTLVPDDPGLLKPRAAKEFTISMRDKVYRPGQLVVQVGDKVTFINEDRIKHNVFSSTPNNRFDLGTYKKGKRPAIAFANPGLVKVYCNLHKRMATYIQVMAADRSAMTDANGFFHIADLPPGRYQLTAWHVMGSVQKTVVIVPANTVNFDLLIDGARYQPAERAAKSGQYPPIPVTEMAEPQGAEDEQESADTPDQEDTPDTDYYEEF